MTTYANTGEGLGVQLDGSAPEVQNPILTAPPELSEGERRNLAVLAYLTEVVRMQLAAKGLIFTGNVMAVARHGLSYCTGDNARGGRMDLNCYIDGNVANGWQGEKGYVWPTSLHVDPTVEQKRCFRPIVVVGVNGSHPLPDIENEAGLSAANVTEILGQLPNRYTIRVQVGLTQFVEQ